MEADGRVLAQDVVSALHTADALTMGTTLPVAQRIASGAVGQPLARGTAVPKWRYFRPSPGAEPGYGTAEPIFYTWFNRSSRCPLACKPSAQRTANASGNTTDCTP